MVLPRGKGVMAEIDRSAQTELCGFSARSCVVFYVLRDNFLHVVMTFRLKRHVPRGKASRKNAENSISVPEQVLQRYSQGNTVPSLRFG